MYEERTGTVNSSTTFEWIIPSLQSRCVEKGQLLIWTPLIVQRDLRFYLGLYIDISEEWIGIYLVMKGNNPPKCTCTIKMKGRTEVAELTETRSKLDVTYMEEQKFLKTETALNSIFQDSFTVICYITCDTTQPITVQKSVQTCDKCVQMPEKSVQTNDSNTGTKYPENQPCLENLSLDLSKLAEGNTDTDVQLKCGDVSIGAHKIILGARSEVFRAMMESDMVEGREGIVKIIDMEPKILKIFIRYIYTGNLPELTVDAALPIYVVAAKYQVEALKKRIGHLLVKNLSPENALVILAAADAHSDSDLKDQLVSYISEEKIPARKVEWQKFCNEYPKLANEVLNFMMCQVFLANS